MYICNLFSVLIFLPPLFHISLSLSLLSPTVSLFPSIPAPRWLFACNEIIAGREVTNIAQVSLRAAGVSGVGALLRSRDNKSCRESLAGKRCRVNEVSWLASEGLWERVGVRELRGPRFVSESFRETVSVCQEALESDKYMGASEARWCHRAWGRNQVMWKFVSQTRCNAEIWSKMNGVRNLWCKRRDRTFGVMNVGARRSISEWQRCALVSCMRIERRGRRPNDGSGAKERALWCRRVPSWHANLH